MRTCHAFGAPAVAAAPLPSAAAVAAATEPIASDVGANVDTALVITPDVGDTTGADHLGWSPRLVTGDDADIPISTAPDPRTAPVMRPLR